VLAGALSDGKPCAALGAARAQDSASATSTHTHSEAEGALAARFGRLIRPFHRSPMLEKKSAVLQPLPPTHVNSGRPAARAENIARGCG
jgi:hypothetical protein